MTPKKREYKILKGQQTISLATLFSISFFCFTVIFASILISVGIYTINEKISIEHDRALYMAELYTSSNAEDDVRLTNYLSESRCTYIVRNEYGNIVDSQGENTCGRSSIKLNLGPQGSCIVYEDLENDNIRFSSVGPVVLPDITKIIKEKRWEESEISTGMFGNHSKKADIPFWVAIPLSDNSEFIVKCQPMLAEQDVMFIIILVVSLVLFLVVIFLSLFRNFSQNREYQKEVKLCFLTDQVTEGNNWNAFLMQAEKILKSSSRQFAIVNVSIVKYRTYCMCHSLEEGEDALRYVSKVLEGNTKSREVCAHVAASNFALLYEMDDENELKERLDKMIRALKRSNPEHTFQFQIGIATVKKPKNGKKRKNVNIEKYYNNACTARGTMFHSDESGMVFFNKELIAEQKWEDTVQEKQKTALKDEEFLVYYQPKYNPEDKRLLGAEALIRWQSPELGFISPNKFIPIFEKNGFISKIDNYMLKHVAEDQKRWKDMGLKCVPVSVNVSRVHFAEDDLAEQIRDIVDEAECPHDLIEIEMTESAFFDDKDALIRIIDRLREYGFSVSMDDFGAGYSSLNSLKDMSFDVLKLDAEFFRGDVEWERKEIVLKETIKLAKNLNMRTVAEGVEDKEQVDFLATEGCDMIQSYYYAKPMPMNEFEDRIRKKYYEETDIPEESR